MPVSEEQIQLVRRFNRFYTRRIGLLREGLLDTPFSLTQARVLFEIAHQPGTRSSSLSAELGLDPAYLSRLLDSFERRKLVKRLQSKEDRRVNILRLTARGRAAFDRLDALSRAETGEMLASLGSSQQRRLTAAMTTIRQFMAPASRAKAPAPPEVPVL